MQKYKYNASDLSYVYHYFTGPLAQWLVDNLTPRWVA